MKEKLKKVKRPAKFLKTKKKKLVQTKKIKDIQAMSVDEFMSDFIGEGTTEGNSVEEDQNYSIENNQPRKPFAVEEKDNESDCGDDAFTSHKKQLNNLKKSDPEFYKYLEQNDQELLNFDDSDADSDEGKNDKFHEAPDSLEVASDESDYEPDDEVKQYRKKSNRVSPDMVKKWQEDLSRGNIKALREVVEAFHAAVVSVSPEEDVTSVYKVEGATSFNSVIRICMMDFLPGMQKALKLPVEFKAHPKNSKNWNKVKPILKSYFSDLIELSGVTSPSMLTVLLKHIHQMSPFIACFPSIAPKFLKRAVQLWASEEDVVRVLSFLCALRLANLRPSLLRLGLKIMHLTYVRNTKFVSPTSLPGINFMRQSLCEMFALDNTISYHMAFLYIRQLAIHLRNAITLKKKDAVKTVYNWAYISSLHLWADLFATVSRNSPFKSLIYPLVQIIIGTIKLIPSAQYFPLRFHCLRILINLGCKCNIFIPIFPFIMEVLRDFNFNREHKKLSVKPMDFTCLLRCSKSQMKENGFKDALIENVHDLLMEYLATECHRISFPDLVVPCVIEMKQFLKTCSVANYNKKMKAVLDKIAENSKFVDNERKKLNLKLDDLNAVETAEVAIRMKEPPFLKYYDSWKKIHIQQQARKITNNQKLGDFKLPILYKLEKKRNRLETKSTGPPELFPSDEDSDNEEILEKTVEEEPPKKRKILKKPVEPKKKIVRKEEGNDLNDAGDILLDLKYSDLA